MTIYTLYKKVDKLSGLHYLGMTKQDPLKYRGSGRDWISHLNTNITDVETTIIYQTTSKREFNQVGRYYSRLWNIVNAVDDYGNKIWANRIPETGGGPGFKTPVTRLGKTNSAEHKQRCSTKLKNRVMTTEHKNNLKKNHADFSGHKHPLAKKYIIVSPSGDEFIIHGTLETFCKVNNLSVSVMRRIANQHLPKSGSCVGWQVNVI
jgi:hypothetical protein